MAGGDTILRAAPVVDQIAADRLMLFADLGQGEKFGRADDGGVHARCTTVVQKHAVEHDACRRREAETDIADPQHHMHAWEVLADQADRLNGGGTIAPVLLNACLLNPSHAADVPTRGEF